MSNIQAQIDALAGSIQVLDNTVSNITGNTLSNYNQLSRIVAQQGNIYNTVYFGTGNLTTGNLSVNNNSSINGNLNVDSGTFLVDSVNNRVGILNTNPQYPLDVKGSANISTGLNVGGLTSTQSAVITTSSGSTTYGLVSEATSASGQRTHIGFRVPTIGELGNIYTSSSSVFGIYGLNTIDLNTPGVYTYGNLTTAGNANITGNLGVKGNLFTFSNLIVNSDGNSNNQLIIRSGYKGSSATNRYVTYDIGITGTHYFWDNMEVSANVGIGGTSAPSANLDVQGNARITGNLNVDSGTFWVDATNNRVGILNTNPQQALDVVGSANISVDTFVRNNLAIGATSAGANLDVVGNARVSGNLNVDSGTFWVDATNNRVGILNTNPQQALDVIGSANISANTFVRNNLAIGATSAGANLDVVGNARISGNLNVDSGTFWVDATNNRIGILNTNPLQALDVVGSANISADTFVRNNLAIGATVASANLDITGNARVSGNLNVDSGTFWVDATNNRVGILNTNPQQALDVVGSANISVNTFVRNNLAVGATSAGANLDVVGNARISGNLNVDSGTFWVDATNNRIGILNTNPQQALDVVGSANISANTFVRNNLAVGSTSASANLDITGNAIISGNLNVDNGALWVDATNSRVGINNTNPQYALDIVGDANVVGALTTTKAIEINTTGNGISTIWVQNNSFAIFRNATYTNQSLQVVCSSDGGTNDYIDYRFIPNNLSTNRSATMRVMHTDPSFITNNGRIDIATGVFGVSGTQSTYDKTINGIGNSAIFRPKLYFQGYARNWEFGSVFDGNAIMPIVCTNDSSCNFMVKSGSGIQVTNSSNYSLVERSFSEALRVNGNSIFNGNLTLNGNINVDSGLIFTDTVNNRVGIRNANPQYAFDLLGGANISTNLYIGSTLYVNQGGAFDCYLTTNQINSGFSTNASAELAINYSGYAGGTTQFRDTTFFNGKNTIIAKLLGSTGNLGIGTSTPVQKLDVRGNAYINGLSIYPGFKQTTATSGYVTYDINASGTHYFWDDVETTGTISAGSPIIPLYNPSTLTSNTYIGFQGSAFNSTLPSGTSVTTIFTQSLPAGVWILEGESDYQNTTTSLRVVGFNTSTGFFDTSRSQNLTSSGGVALRVTTVYSLTSTTTIYFLISNSGGTTSSAINNLRYTRIA